MKVMNNDIVTLLEVITLRSRQDRGEASKRRGETETALLLPRGEASVSRHTSRTQCRQLNVCWNNIHIKNISHAHVGIIQNIT